MTHLKSMFVPRLWPAGEQAVWVAMRPRLRQVISLSAWPALQQLRRQTVSAFIGMTEPPITS